MNGELPSKKQRALLEFIDTFIKDNGYAPSYREVMRALDYKSVSTVAKHIEGLTTRGWLVKRDNSARSVEVRTGGQGTPGEKSPAPSLPADETAWLAGLIRRRLAEGDIDDNTRESLDRTLVFLGLEDIREELRLSD